MTTSTRHALAVLLMLAAVVIPVRAQDMPDPKSMSGTPLPVADLTPGTVVIRVVKGTMTNVVPNVPVVLDVAGTPRTVSTSATGHAEFTALPVGARVKAVFEKKRTGSLTDIKHFKLI